MNHCHNSYQIVVRIKPTCFKIANMRSVKNSSSLRKVGCTHFSTVPFAFKERRWLRATCVACAPQPSRIEACLHTDSPWPKSGNVPLPCSFAMRRRSFSWGVGGHQNEVAHCHLAHVAFSIHVSANNRPSVDVTACRSFAPCAELAAFAVACADCRLYQLILQLLLLRALLG